MDSMTLEEHVDRLRTTGFTVIEDALGAEDVAFVRGEIDAAVDAFAPPSYYAREFSPLADDAAVTPAGFVFTRLLSRCPTIESAVLAPMYLDLAEHLLGDELRLEMVGVAISDAQRVPHSWHTHIDGKDEGYRQDTHDYPRKDRFERLLALLYLTDIDDDAGLLYVYPRKVGERTEPHGDLFAGAWPGEIAITARPGTLVVLDEATWHRAEARRVDGRRIFVALAISDGRREVGEWSDPSLESWCPPSAL